MPSSACQTCALRSEEHTSELQSHSHLVCRLLLAKKKKITRHTHATERPEARRNRQARPTRSPAAVRPGGVHDPRRLGDLEDPCVCFFFFNDTATTEIYTLSLHDALPI